MCIFILSKPLPWKKKSYTQRHKLLYTHNIRMCEIDIGNPKYTTFTKLVQVRNFIHLFQFKGFPTWGETQSFYDDFSICPSTPPLPPRAAPSRKLLVWSRRGKNLTNCFFSNLSPRFRCVTSPKDPSPIPIWDFYFDISEWHILSAHVNTCVNVASN